MKKTVKVLGTPEAIQTILKESGFNPDVKARTIPGVILKGKFGGLEATFTADHDRIQNIMDNHSEVIVNA